MLVDTSRKEREERGELWERELVVACGDCGLLVAGRQIDEERDRRVESLKTLVLVLIHA
jgi:hypothetical protein